MRLFPIIFSVVIICTMLLQHCQSTEYNEDWVIEKNTEVKNEKIVVTGNIIVKSGAKLKMIDSIIYINCSHPYEYGLIVEAGGELEVIDSAILPMNDSCPYSLEIKKSHDEKEHNLLIGLLIGFGAGFPIGIYLMHYLYRRWFSKNLPPPV